MRKLASEIGARSDLYPRDYEKLYTVLGTASTGAKGGAWVGGGVGTVVGGVLAPVGAMVGSMVGGAGGASVSIFLAESKEAAVEARPVKNFLIRIVECGKLANIEPSAKPSLETSMGAVIPQIFVVTKQFSIFALYPFTLKRGPTVLGDYVIEEHGINPTELIKTSYGE